MKVGKGFTAGILGFFGWFQAFGANLAPLSTPAWIAPASVPECQVTPPADTSARAAVAAADAKLKCTQALKIHATAKASTAPDASQAVAAVVALDQQQKQDEKAKADADARLSFLG